MSDPHDQKSVNRATPAEHRPRARSVRSLLLQLVFACIIPAVIGAGLLLYQAYRSGRSQIERDALQTTRAMSLSVDAHLIKSITLAQALATSTEFARLDLAGFHRHATELVRLVESGTNVVVSDLEGNQVVNTRLAFGAALPRLRSLDQLRRVRETLKPAISDVYMGGITGRPVISIDVPVFSGSTMTHLLSIGLDLQQLNRILAAQRLPPDWVGSIVDRSGTNVARSRASQEYAGTRASPQTLAPILAATEGTFEWRTREGVPSLFVFSRSPLSNWSVVVAIPLDSVQAELWRNLALLGLGATTLLTLGGALAWGLGGRVSGSVRALVAVASSLGAGQPLGRLVLPVREANEVAAEMETASQRLMQREQALHEAHEVLALSRAELEQAQRVAGMASWRWDASTGKETHASNMYTLIGHAVEPGSGTTMQALYPPETWQQVSAARQAALASGGSFSLELQIVRADGTTGWVNSRGEAVRDAQGGIVGLRGTVQDITERKRYDDELRRSNAELEQFAYVASHDLQEPLRMVASYTELLAQRYKGKLDERGDKYIFYAVDGAKRMQRLVSDLLAYSRVGSEGKPLETVATDAVLARVLEMLAPLILEAGAVVEVTPLPEVQGDESQLAQLFQNLIGNAVKFRGTQTPRVCIDARPDAGRWVFSVADNGIGIEPQYTEQIFQMFQRLHARDEYEGSGIGLAIAKRIVERHGGKLWFESTPGMGTTFHFSLLSAAAKAQS